MQSINKTSFTIGAVITLVLGIGVLTCSYLVGKQHLFLLLNTDLGNVTDHFFVFATWLGDGLMWLPVLALFLLWKRKELLPLLISSFLLTTILTQICKYLIVPHALRPIMDIADKSLIHTVPGVELHEVSSFPSGHTATAFTFYLLFCCVLPRRKWIILGLAYALSVAYSRVYLAQHFPVDLGAGMIVGLISVSASLLVQQRFANRKKKA